MVLYTLYTAVYPLEVTNLLRTWILAKLLSFTLPVLSSSETGYKRTFSRLHAATYGGGSRSYQYRVVRIQEKLLRFHHPQPNIQLENRNGSVFVSPYPKFSVFCFLGSGKLAWWPEPTSKVASRSHLPLGRTRDCKTAFVLSDLTPTYRG